MWTAYQFDSAVTRWGIHVDNRLKEVNPDGSPKHTLRELLDIPLTPEEARAMTRQSFAMLDMRARDRKSGIVVD